MDNAAFDRLTRLFAAAGSRRQALSALVAGLATGGTAEALLAADRHGKGHARGNSKPHGKAAAEAKKGKGKGKGDGNDKGKGKGKGKGKEKGKGNNHQPHGKRCGNTPLEPGQDFLNCDFSNDNLSGENLNGSSFKTVTFVGANLCGANLASASVSDSNFNNANLTQVDLRQSTHSKSTFRGANLTNAQLQGATISKSDFSGANFNHANLLGANLADVDLSGAVFCQTTLPDGSVDNSGCDSCENSCGCLGCSEYDCLPPDCCEGTCVDTQNGDVLNCGGCFVACYENLADNCVDGECVCGEEPECSGGEQCCRGSCVDFDTSFRNCGSCGFSCLEGVASVCDEGECQCGAEPPCSGGLTCCGNGAEASCVDLQTDVDFCGSCDESCAIPLNPCLEVSCVDGKCITSPKSDGAICQTGDGTGVCCAAGETVTCVVGAVCCSVDQCESGDTCCSGQCVDLQTDFDNCGDCGDICPPEESNLCSAGTCRCGAAPQCDEGFGCCGDGSGGVACTNLQTDLDNCGACGNDCPASTNPCAVAVCANGSCGFVSRATGAVCEIGGESGVCCDSSEGVVCFPNLECCSSANCTGSDTCCSGQCVDTQSDLDNCGECDVICPATRADICISGGCLCGSSPVCAPDALCCGGQCLTESLANCGACGATCPASKADACISGECRCGNGEACPQSTSCCEAECIDTTTNFGNCGGCGQKCNVNADQCVNSACVCGTTGSACGQGLTCCSGNCVDLLTNFSNCGACQNPCTNDGTVNVCANGECRCGDNPPCLEGFFCDGGSCVAA